MKKFSGILFIVIVFLASCNEKTNEEKTVLNNNGPEKSAPEYEQKILSAWNDWDTAKFKASTTAMVLRNSNGNKEGETQQDYIKSINSFHTAFPDLKISIDSSTHIDGKSYIYWTLSGVNSGKLGDAAPTNRRVTVHGFSVWFGNAEGLAYREDAFFDNLDLYNQMGYTLAPPAK